MTILGSWNEEEEEDDEGRLRAAAGEKGASSWDRRMKASCSTDSARLVA